MFVRVSRRVALLGAVLAIGVDKRDFDVRTDYGLRLSSKGGETKDGGRDICGLVFDDAAEETSAWDIS